MCLRFTRKTFKIIFELGPNNGLKPASHKKRQMPISNRLHPKEIFERNRCASGWSHIYDHSTNPVNKNAVIRSLGSFGQAQT